MRGKKHSYSHASKIGKTKKRVKNLARIVRRSPPREAPDGERQCIYYAKENCALYHGKELKKMCPNGLGYLRDKNQNPNNWSACDGWKPGPDTKSKTK